MKKVIVIGGGAAGMMAAITASEYGAETTLREKNAMLGKKISITGKGRCNLTNQCSIPELIKNIPGNGSFLYGAFHRFSVDDTMSFFHSLGLPLKVEQGRRVFPTSDKAYDVLDVLKKRLRQLDVKLEYNAPDNQLVLQQDLQSGSSYVVGLKTEKGFLPADAVIIATGGMSYPATGSTGDGYRIAELAGHLVVPPRPSLVPLETKEAWVEELSGLSLRNVAVRAYVKEKVLDKGFGEMLFTHFGVSGPVILRLSHAVCNTFFEAPKAEITIHINLKPALSKEQLQSRIQRDLDRYSRKYFANSLDDLLPQSLIPVIVRLSGIDPEKPANQITKEERNCLTELLQDLTVHVKGTRPIDEAIVTAGGVSVREINPKTMESKLVSGLYFAGEVMDVDGFTGGYNLQAAFSSGRVAGMAAAGKL